MPTDDRDRGPDAWVRRVHEVLRRAFRRAGRGSVRRVERELGIAQGSFRQWRRRGKLGVGVLFRALETLGVEPALFWVEIFGCEMDPVVVASRPTGRPRDPVVREVIERWEAPERRKAKTWTEDELRRLDTLRDEDPRAAVRQVRAALKSAGKRWLSRLLAVYGSARRAEARLDVALEALRYALLFAEREGDRVLAADILQRLGVVTAYQGNLRLALLFAKKACYEHQLAGNERGEGRSWVDQGVWYFHLGHFDHAIAAHERALSCLPGGEVRHRFTAYQCLAVLHQRQKGFDKALRYVVCAEKVGRQRVGKSLWGRLIWTKAEIAIALQEYELAEQCYAEALEIYKIASPIDAALAAVELARVQVVQGKIELARETTMAMASLLKALQKNRVVSAALMQLFRIPLEHGRITVHALDQTRREIRKERARLERRARLES